MSVLTLAVLAIIIFLSRHELVKAWNLFLHADFMAIYSCYYRFRLSCTSLAAR